MSDVTIRKIDEIEPYGGPGAIEGIKFRSAGRALGVKSWGMAVLTLAPRVAGYPEHDHVKDGQEEVYLVLEGSATLRTGEQNRHVEPGMLVRVAPGVMRKWLPGDRGVTLLAIGGTPGKAYEPRG